LTFIFAAPIPQLSSIRSMSTFLSSQRAEYLDLHRHLSANSSGRRGRALTNADRDKLEAEVNRAVMDINAKIDQLKESIRDPPPEEEEEEEEAEPEDDHERAARAARALERQQNNADVRAHQHTVIILLFDALRQLAASMAALKTARTAQLKADLEERHPGALAAAKKQDAEREERRMRGAAAGGDNSAAATSTSAAAAAAASSAVDLLPSALGKAVSSSLGKLQRIGGLDAGGGQNGAAAPVIDGQCHAHCSCSCGAGCWSGLSCAAYSHRVCACSVHLSVRSRWSLRRPVSRLQRAGAPAAAGREPPPA